MGLLDDGRASAVSLSLPVNLSSDYELIKYQLSRATDMCL